jgi:hypothetical protein
MDDHLALVEGGTESRLQAGSPSPTEVAGGPAAAIGHEREHDGKPPAGGAPGASIAPPSDRIYNLRWRIYCQA